MNQIIETILQRRSCRTFTGEPVSEQDIRTVLDCALAAPSGMGKQTWRFTAVMNKDKIRQLAAAVAAALNRGSEYTMYSPEVLIITSNEKSSKFREVDNACAMENIYLVCESLNLGCVWINQLLDCYDDPAVRAMLHGFGIPENHGVYGCAAIGHKGSKPNEKEIKGTAIIVH